MGMRKWDILSYNFPHYLPFSISVSIIPPLYRGFYAEWNWMKTENILLVTLIFIQKFRTFCCWLLCVALGMRENLSSIPRFPSASLTHPDGFNSVRWHRKTNCSWFSPLWLNSTAPQDTLCQDLDHTIHSPSAPLWIIHAKYDNIMSLWDFSMSQREASFWSTFYIASEWHKRKNFL